jgi:hypothetical protein
MRERAAGASVVPVIVVSAADHALTLRPARGAAGSNRIRVATVIAGLSLLATVYLSHAAARWLAAPLPLVQHVSPYHVLVDTTPVTITVTAAAERLPMVATHDALLTDAGLWQRMHLADWNTVPTPLRHQALDAMLARHTHLLFSPRQWDRMTADDWDDVPQPVRTLAFRHMVEYWSGFYEVGHAHGLPPRLVSDTLTAIVMSESWFDHRAVNVGYRGQRDFGLAQASDSARRRMRRLYEDGLVDVNLTDDDYFNPWLATRFVAIWMADLLQDTNGDLDFAVRAYHRGLTRARDTRGDGYSSQVWRRFERFIRNGDAPPAWDYLWRRDRRERREAWPWILGSYKGR